MRKRIKLFVSMLAAAAMLVLLPGGNALTVKAEGNTYSIQFFGGAINDWCYVTGSTFDVNQSYSTVGGLRLRDLKDGDHIVVYDSGDKPTRHLDLSGFNLGSLTIHQNVTAVFFADSIRDCYVLAGAYATVNGNVTNAFLYDTTTCTFNNDVLDMELYYTGEPTSSITCGGTVGHFCIWTKDKQTRRNEFFDIPKGTMNLDGGIIQFTWSPTPSESYLQARAAADGTAPADTAATPAPSSATPAAGTAADEYDAVPKTGDNSHIIWLSATAALLFAASFCLYRKEK